MIHDGAIFGYIFQSTTLLQRDAVRLQSGAE